MIKNHNFEIRVDNVRFEFEWTDYDQTEFCPWMNDWLVHVYSVDGELDREAEMQWDTWIDHATDEADEQRLTMNQRAMFIANKLLALIPMPKGGEHK